MFAFFGGSTTAFPGSYGVERERKKVIELVGNLNPESLQCIRLIRAQFLGKFSIIFYKGDNFLKYKKRILDLFARGSTGGKFQVHGANGMKITPVSVTR